MKHIHSPHNFRQAYSLLRGESNSHQSTVLLSEWQTSGEVTAAVADNFGIHAEARKKGPSRAPFAKQDEYERLFDEMLATFSME
jgi:hypothetical protein